MLVLTREAGESVWIGDNICVTVVRLKGGQVKTGIEAPRTWRFCATSWLTIRKKCRIIGRSTLGA